MRLRANAIIASASFAIVAPSRRGAEPATHASDGLGAGKSRTWSGVD